MPFYKAWDVRREKRKFIVADSFADLVCKGANFIQIIFGLDLLAIDEY